MIDGTARDAGALASVRAGDAEVRYRDWSGPADRPPLVLVHGFLVNHREWEDVAPVLAKSRRVLALDLPGFGASPIPAGSPPGFRDFAATVVSFAGALGIDAADLAGHSMGGGVAIAVAASNPSFVRRLVAIDALSFPADMPLKARLPLLPVIGPFIFKRLYGRRMFLDYFRNDVVRDPASINADRVDHYYRAFDAPGRRDYAYEILRLTHHPGEIPPLAARVRCPTLVLWGEEDRLIRPDVGRRLEAAIPGARLRTIPACGHAPPEEKPHETAREIDSFLLEDAG